MLIYKYQLHFFQHTLRNILMEFVWVYLVVARVPLTVKFTPLTAYRTVSHFLLSTKCYSILDFLDKLQLWLGYSNRYSSHLMMKTFVKKKKNFIVVGQNNIICRVIMVSQLLSAWNFCHMMINHQIEGWKCFRKKSYSIG